ncbi:class I adenylate-forming enzyme family protein [Alkalihalobacterium elongatum]|uniref:class I adenylate-forming enzyme family protein n=1 Tax=Alkalihalobacterium elongatum TaxID=2675466 RepID=UPI001C1F346E|nr:AMP-binding protein [Alkalihalobacterium elongatum]
MVSLKNRRLAFEKKSKEWTPEPVHEFFFRMAEEYKENEYIISQKKTWTYSDVMKQSKQLAAGLIKLGLENHEHVALIFPNHPEFILSKFGVAAAGGILVPLNYRLKKEDFKYLINQSDSSYIITLDVWNSINYVSLLKELCPEVFEGASSEVFPNLKEIIVYSPEGNKYPGTTDFYDLLSSIDTAHIEGILSSVPKGHVGDVTDIMYTSGTTSFPKGALITHDMIWRSALGSCINRGFQEGRKIFVPIPFYHCFGYIEGIIAVSMVGGAIIPQINFDEFQALGLIETHKANDILCVPTIGLKLLEAQRKKSRNLSSLRAMYCAGAEVSTKMWKEIKEVLNIAELITGYGMTECAAGVLQTDPSDDISYLSKYVGRTIPGGHIGLSKLNGNNIQFNVKDIGTGEYQPYGIEGELVCKGPLVTSGYYKKSEETEKSLDEEGWFKTGDLAVLDENGYISLTGRIKEIYRIGAENVAPKEIEDILTRHDKVNQAYVIGVPDEVMGEVGMAWIVLEPQVALSENEVFDYASKHLAKFKVPKYIKFIQHAELPMTSNGKVQKFKLKEWYLQGKVQSLF